MLPIVVLLLVVGVSAELDLPPATITGVSTKNFEFLITGKETPNALASKISGIQGSLEFNDQAYLNQISGEILLQLDLLERLPFRSLRWQLKINTRVGVLRVIDIIAKARPAANSHKILVVVGKAVEIVQETQWPPRTNLPLRVRCMHERQRQPFHFRYLLDHRYRWDCDLIQGFRGLTPAEIVQINQALTQKLPEAVKKLQ